MTANVINIILAILTAAAAATKTIQAAMDE